MTFSAFCARCKKKVKKAERIIRYFDMFAGVGGFRAGLNFAGGFQCIGHCEIDKYADASYRAIHAPGKEEVYYPDARTIDPKELPDFDLLCGGFPCQAFSTAGRRNGFEDARGTLFFELARVVKEKRPPYLFLENVSYVWPLYAGRHAEKFLWAFLWIALVPFQHTFGQCMLLRNGSTCACAHSKTAEVPGWRVDQYGFLGDIPATIQQFASSAALCGLFRPFRAM